MFFLLGFVFLSLFCKNLYLQETVVPVNFRPIKDASLKTGVAAGWNRLCTKPGKIYFVRLSLACRDDMKAVNKYWFYETAH